jgi:hypothetical protein
VSRAAADLMAAHGRIPVGELARIDRIRVEAEPVQH